MQMIDRDIATSTALVIDANPTSRGILAAQLRDFGVGTVVQANKIHDARRILESRSFDIVLCEQDFEAEGYSGQNLLDDLRRLQLLPLSSAFVIITGTASTTAVAEAAASSVDSYVVKPFTASTLAERLTQIRKRKKALADVHAAVAAGEVKGAAMKCLERFQARGPHHLDAARLGCELLLGMGENEVARQLHQKVLDTDATLPWARLGLARAQLAAGQAGTATRTLQALVADQPRYPDALDVFGRLQVEQGDLAAAAATYRTAADFTRGSIVRLQRHGLLAFYAGLYDEAAKPLDRALVLGLGSPMFDPHVLAPLAALRFAQRDQRALMRVLDAMREVGGASTRLADLVAFAWHRQDEALARVCDDAAAALDDPAFDADAACQLLVVWSQLAAAGTTLPHTVPAAIDRLATRFAASRALGQLLVGAAAPHGPFADLVMGAQQTLATRTEGAVTQALEGQPEVAVRGLLDAGRRTLNARLLELAGLTLQRHRERIEAADALARDIEDARRRVSQGAALPMLGHAARG